MKETIPASNATITHMSLRTVYPPIEANDWGMLSVGDDNEIYWEVCGNPDGNPVVMLHGGPGGGCNAGHRQQFDPTAYRIVLLDQRNCGRSRPHASDPSVSLQANTTWRLISDLEQLREHLNIGRWQVFGGSWGSTLALAYAQCHPERVTELVLRGIFMLRPDELNWFCQDGAKHLLPDKWKSFVAPIPADERHNLIAAYKPRLDSYDTDIRVAAAQAWARWEGEAITLHPDQTKLDSLDDPDTAVAFARIENHYFTHNGWLEPDQLLQDIDRIRRIPAVIVQGRYDLCTPPATAWQLHQAWPEADFHLVDGAGHAHTEPGIMHHLIEATDRFRFCNV